MESIKSIYKIGHGPSSSHTMGPNYAAEAFLKRNKDADKFVVELYGSLALTGKGHLTDRTILDVLGEYRTEVVFKPEICYEYHSNGMKFISYKDNKQIDEWLVFSIGGGNLKNLGEKRSSFGKDIYPHNKMSEILAYIKNNNMSLIQYIRSFEENDLDDYLDKVFVTMENAALRGLSNHLVLPGSLKLQRRAFEFYDDYKKTNNYNSLLFALTLAIAEENASGGLIVTAPTCGSAGIIPGILLSEYYHNKLSKEKIYDALAIAGLISNIVKTNASISGAEVGCQGEVGVACSSASAMLAFLNGGTTEQIEYASEIALEHHLGMTCDPVDGLVQIPCIERNAMAADFAYAASRYALLTNGKHYVTLEEVIRVMNETGKDIDKEYKETSIGGLAKVKKEENI